MNLRSNKCDHVQAARWSVFTGLMLLASATLGAVLTVMLNETRVRWSTDTFGLLVGETGTGTIVTSVAADETREWAWQGQLVIAIRNETYGAWATTKRRYEVTIISKNIPPDGTSSPLPGSVDEWWPVIKDDVKAQCKPSIRTHVDRREAPHGEVVEIGGVLIHAAIAGLVAMGGMLCVVIGIRSVRRLHVTRLTPSRRRRGQCPTCGYSRCGLDAGRCPECGSRF